MKLKKNIQKKYIAIKILRTKFNTISKYYDIFKFFITSEKYFLPKIKKKFTFLKIKPNISLTIKCFPLTNFSNNKQTQINFKNNFLKITFPTNKHPYRKCISMFDKFQFCVLDVKGSA